MLISHKFTTLAVVLFTASAFVLAARSAPSTRPAGAEVAAAGAAGPSTRAVRRATTARAPADIIREFKERRDKKAAMPKVAYIALNEPVTERPSTFTLTGQDNALTLHGVLTRLRQARDDNAVRGVLLTLGNTNFGLSQAMELRDALVELRKANKRTFIYADGYDTAAYIAASGATDICMLGGGEIMMPGVSIETMFARGLLDKLGVKADYIQIGEYKGADEQFTRTEPSKELRGEMNKLIDSLYDQILSDLAVHRKLSRDQVKAVIDEAIITGQGALDRKLVDHLVDIDGLRDLMGKELGSEVDLLGDYGAPEKETLDLSNPFAILTTLGHRPDTDERPAVALVYAQGVITDGSGGGGLFSESGVGSDEIRKAMRMASRDERVKAIVVRIDSPGGSALASEAMWQAVHRAAAKKPVIISIGGMAASGGYYLASAGDRIFADPSAIVGSIGVVGGKFVVKDLFNKVGITTEAFSRGNNADLFTSSQPFSDSQRAMVTGWMKQTYDQFTQRVMAGRKNKIKDIDLVARGRIFMAKQAKDLGMVDDLGGVEDALTYAAAKSNLAAGDYQVLVLPPTKSLIDLLTSDEGPEAKLPFHVNLSSGEMELLKTIDPKLVRQFAMQLQVMQLFQQRPVMLISPWSVELK